MAEQIKSVTQRISESAPNSRQTVKFLTAATIGTTLLVLSGLILTGTVISLVIATPLLVLFSPILIPAAIVVFLVATGFLFSGGCAVAALSVMSWTYNYMSGKHPLGSDQLDYARTTLANKAKEYGQYVQQKAQEVTQGQGQGY
ncbi:PREDICTED: oleosin 16 kDa [Nelumbo nucifera]|uniref:Oleosin n=2 Tax=Nelumbo nucifera TaxID=4432 RepID=A0A822ZJ10_NELNU|nr:PREDICTED: oleosin 16 kDa [Nelumbo nucifera]DAD44540.1 TPA_asm: hypothetical protein HUJ06_002770 [Nelumbo nucifera]